MPSALLVGDFASPDPAARGLLDSFASSLPEGWQAKAATPGRLHGEGRARGPVDIAHQVKAADAVVVAGGTPFGSRTKGPRREGGPRSYAPWTFAGSAFGKPVALVGVGAEWPRNVTARAFARGLVRRSDLLVLRDEGSAGALTASGAPTPFRIGADPTWVQVDRPLEWRGSSNDVAMVVIDARGTSALTVPWLTDAIRSTLDAGLRVRLQPWCATDSGGDVDLARYLYAELDGCVEVAGPTPDMAGARAAMGDCGVVMAENLHPLIAAASAGARFVAVSMRTGPRDLARRFDQTALSPNVAPDQVGRALMKRIAGAVPNVVALRSQIASAEEGFRLLRLLLQEGRTAEADEITGLPLSPARWDGFETGELR